MRLREDWQVQEQHRSDPAGAQAHDVVPELSEPLQIKSHPTLALDNVSLNEDAVPHFLARCLKLGYEHSSGAVLL